MLVARALLGFHLHGAGHATERLLAACALAAVVGCDDPGLRILDPMEQRTPDPIDASRLDRLRAFGEGCAVLSTDNAGVRRGFGVPRHELPFTVPAIDRSPTGRSGNGVVRRIVVQPPGGPVTLNCLVPVTLTPQALVASLQEAVGTDPWGAMLRSVQEARELPSGFDQPQLEGEVALFERELLLPRFAPTGASMDYEDCYEYNRVPNPPASFECMMECEGWDITIWFNGDTWSFHIEVYGCTYQGGNGYGWLVDNWYLQWCGGPYPNDADVLREQYRNYSLDVVPDCGYFLYQPESQYFGYDVIRSHDRDYTHAIFRTAIKDAIDWLKGQLDITITTLNRIYSSPAHQANKNASAMNSRHVYGDAADIHSTSATWQDLRNDAINVLSTDPCVGLDPISWTPHLP